jgi:uncharacterized MAPEG superfamily protein
VLQQAQHVESLTDISIRAVTLALIPNMSKNALRRWQLITEKRTISMTPFIAPHSITALIFYALWAIALVLMVAADRLLLVLRGKAKANSFTAGVPHGTESYWRINRAHMNTLENLPIFAAIVLSGWVVGMETATFNRLAVTVLVTRIVQSVIHIASGSVPAVALRFAAFAIQIACEVWMAALVLHQGGLF